jgi:hypothetical protein
MDTLLNKRSVSFASIVVDSLGNKVVDHKKIGKKNTSFRVDVNSNPFRGEGGVLPLTARDDHCIVDDDDWKLRYSDRGVSEEEGEGDEEFHILQRVAAYPPASPKRKRELVVTESKEFEARTVKRQKTTTFIAPIEQAQNSLVCKVYLVDRSSLVNRWRRLVIPSSTYCQTVVDIIADSFNIERSSTFYAKKQSSDKYVFNSGPTKKHAKHAILVPFSEMSLDAGDGLDIFYGQSQFNFRVEFVRDASSLKYNIEREDSLIMESTVNNVHIVGANQADHVLL